MIWLFAVRGQKVTTSPPRHLSAAIRRGDAAVNSWQQLAQAPSGWMHRHPALDPEGLWWDVNYWAQEEKLFTPLVHVAEAKFRGLSLRDYTEAGRDNGRCLGSQIRSPGPRRAVICVLAEAQH